MKSIFVFVLSVVLTCPVLVSANEDMEVFISLHNWSTVQSQGHGKTVRLGGDVMRGVGLGVPLNDKFTVNAEFLFGDPSTTITPGSNATADMMMFDLNLDYKVRYADWSGGGLAPYLTAGIGSMNFNQDTTGGIDEWDLSYSMGAGLYWDMGGDVFMKLSYRWLWVDMDLTGSTELFDGVSFAIGLSF